MSVTRAAQRDFDIADTERAVKDIEEAILAGEHAERLASNPDWKKVCEYYAEATKMRTAELDELKRDLVSKAMTPADSAKLREQVMLLERDRVNAEDFVLYPQRVVEGLKEMRQSLELRKMELRKLKGDD